MSPKEQTSARGVPPSVSVRPSTVADAEFLFALFKAALGGYVVQTFGPWDESVQRLRFFASLEPGDHQIIELAGRPIGCMKVRWLNDAVCLDRIYLLPEHQGRGIGTALILGVLGDPRREGLPVRLRVLKVNPARRLYERLGFRLADQTATHDLMQQVVSTGRSEETPAADNAITAYAADTTVWEPWHREYRFGVLLIYPPEPLRSAVNALRAQHDPRSQSSCDAHVSLTVPLPRPLTQRHWQELAAIAAAIPRITVSYGPLMNYLPHPGVCLAIQPQAELDALRAALEAAPAFSGAPPRRYPFSAHMTIAEFVSVERTRSLMFELAEVAPRGTFLCDGVSYAVPDEGPRFTERGRLGLKG